MASEPPIMILHNGDFGHAVARHLGRWVSNAVIVPETAQGGLEEILQHPTAIAVFCSSHPVHRVSELLDARSFAIGVPHLSISIQDGAIVLGPVVIPGEGCCWRCWASREEMQSEIGLETILQRKRHYASPMSSGPQGHLASLALLAAAQLLSVLEAIRTSSAKAGEVYWTDMYMLQRIVVRPIGFDNCERCGLQRPLQTRSYAHLRAALLLLWSNCSKDDDGWRTQDGKC